MSIMTSKIDAILSKNTTGLTKENELIELLEITLYPNETAEQSREKTREIAGRIIAAHNGNQPNRNDEIDRILDEKGLVKRPDPRQPQATGTNTEPKTAAEQTINDPKSTPAKEPVKPAEAKKPVR